MGIAAVYVAFTLSGVAGLSYELLWTRYLTLYVGHSAYAQVLVLTVYLGGMAVGALAVSDFSKRLRRPFAAYAVAEGLLAALGLLFHPAFEAVVRFSYDAVLPALGGPASATAVRWGLGALLLLPPAIVLGATFPLMAAGLVRRDAAHPGGGVAGAYLANTLGGAVGVLACGFALIPTLGLPGALAATAIINALAGLLVMGSGLAWRLPVAGGAPPPELEPLEREGRPRARDGALVRLVLTVAFGTALASFAYEVGWIRLLSLVLGSATHAFELMLSAFLLGLGLGALLVRSVADTSPSPLRLLGTVQWVMGLMALATLPFYGWLFDATAYLVDTLSARDGGYLVYNLSRYSLVLAVMLPATILAGTTLPLLTGTLLRARVGEESIGRVYGANTLGSVVGAMGAGLLGLPLLGVRGLLVAGAALDMALGVWLLARVGTPGRRRLPLVAALLGGLVCLAVGAGVRLDQAVLTSGVFRYGAVPPDSARRMLYYHDGRTATVGVHWLLGNQLLVLTTNGKPDASLDARWLEAGPKPEQPVPLQAQRDATTQLVAPLVALAHAPRAHRVVNVGHGSGMSGSALLSSPALDSLVTVEIEPAMVEGSLSFLPANSRVFEDPRSTFVFDDARAYLAYAGRPFDLVFAEPSNPWVSGTSSLFTAEFYAGVRRHLAPGGVLAQWMQLYEIDDDLVLSVLAAIDAEFGDYRGYLVGDGDLLVVATPGPSLPEPEWAVTQWPEVRSLLAGVPPFLPQHLDPLLLFDRSDLRPVLDEGVAPNSDLRPVLDQGAERTLFRRMRARGFLALGISRVDLRRIFSGEAVGPEAEPALVPAKGLLPAVRRGRSAWLHQAEQAGGGMAPEAYPEWEGSLVALRDYLAQAASGVPPDDWRAWTATFERVEGELHAGTAGWVDEPFYAATRRYLDAAGAPPEARAAVDLLHGVGSWDFEEAARAARILVPPTGGGVRWLSPGVVLDAATVAYLETGQPGKARAALEALTVVSGRGEKDLRVRLLDARVSAAGG